MRFSRNCVIPCSATGIAKFVIPFPNFHDSSICFILIMVTSYFQALGVAVKSLMITMMRNIVLFIPVVILLNSLWKLNGVIAAQPVVETILAIVCIVMYARDSKVNRIVQTAGRTE